ncbi:DUF3048 domain-containing protein [Planococcus sp. ISL-110]|uniref:DUF3048 domain-containing protein n=1 Tax=Planococcus sp. ISL-110 TaxID=2819167 RepID=UPI001BE77BB9|nr:DUF3048 domain-containing protein [Planococcus sp. ISL-110]MBT2572241.1 DUF3048 domain-containing protein [Planococcus sp. ISL-110]
MKKLGLIIGIVIVLAAFVAGFWLIMKEDPTEQPPVEEALTIAPFTGEEAVPPANRRTVMAVINNHPDARPQTGLTEADIVFEMIAEYDITRFVALYQSSFPDTFGPIRSAREYFVELAVAYDAFFVAHGYSPDAYTMLESGIVDHVNGIQHDGTLFQRSSDRVAPHNSYITMKNIETAMENVQASAEYSGKSPYHFYGAADNAKLDEQALSVRVEYGTNELFFSDFTYDSQLHLYSRSVGGVPTTDKETLETAEVSNVLVFEASHETVDSEGRQSIDLSSGGDALLFQNGGVREIEWSSLDGMLVPTADGEVVQLVPGKTWIHVVPDSPGMEQSVSYTP